MYAKYSKKMADDDNTCDSIAAAIHRLLCMLVMGER